MRKVEVYQWCEADLKYIKKWLESNIGIKFTKRQSLEFAIHLASNLLNGAHIPSLKEVYDAGDTIGYYVSQDKYSILHKLSEEKKQEINTILSIIIRYVATALPPTLF